MGIAEKLTGNPIRGSKSLPVVLPVNQLAALVSEEERRITAGSGRRLYERYPRSGRLGRCLKILLDSPTWASTEFALSWQPWVTRSERFVFRLAPSTRHIAVGDCGLLAPWPTPTALDGKSVQMTGECAIRRAQERRGPRLSESLALTRGMIGNCSHAGRRMESSSAVRYEDFVAWLMGFDTTNGSLRA